MMSTPRMQYATDVTDAQWRPDRTVAAAFEVATGRSGSAAAGSTPNRQRPFVFEQNGVSLGFVAWLFWAVENGI